MGITLLEGCYTYQGFLSAAANTIEEDNFGNYPEVPKGIVLFAIGKTPMQTLIGSLPPP
jgi:hypothetical protein